MKKTWILLILVTVLLIPAVSADSLFVHPSPATVTVCHNYPDEQVTASVRLTNNLDFQIQWHVFGHHDLPLTYIQPDYGYLLPHESIDVAIISMASHDRTLSIGDYIGDIGLEIENAETAGELLDTAEIPVIIKVRNCRPVPGDGWEAPEFPSSFLPLTMIVCFVGAVLLIQRTREN